MKLRIVPHLLTILTVVSAVGGAAHASDKRLTVETSPIGKAWLAYGGEPLFAFGPADESRFISGMADMERWAEWQTENGMNLVRCYPLNIAAAAWGGDGEGIEPFRRRDGKWDVDRFNDAYFDHLAAVAKRLEEHEIVLHLQLWQIVCFKGGSTRWEVNHLNPANNVNEWTREFRRGHQYIDAKAGSRAREHQKEWVLRILDAIQGRGNVLVDVINELGNEMGTIEWANVVVEWIREWEAENDWKFPVGVDSEHHYRPGKFEPHKHLYDIIILNELQSRGHARSAIERLGMPAVSVRSSDLRNQRDHYVFSNPDQTGPEHQTRYRTLCYRSMFAGLQSVGAYWKMPVDVSDYRDMEHWPSYSRALRAYWNRIKPHWPELEVDDSMVEETAAPHGYAMKSPDLATVYLECGPQTWNNSYPESDLVLKPPFEPARIELFDTKTGEVSEAGKASREGGVLRVSLPAFTDDLALLLWREAPSD